MKISLDLRLKNLTDWFYRNNNRPLLGFYLGSEYPLRRYPASRRNLPDGKVKPGDIVVDDYLEDCERLYEAYEEAGGDLVWSAAPFFGIPWVEAALGCEVIADHNAGSTRSGPPVDFALNRSVPVFSVDNPWIVKLDEFIRKLKVQSGGRYPVGVTLMRGISDLLSALYGGENFILQMYDTPDEVLDIARKLTEFWISFGRFMIDGLELFHGGTGSFFYSVWCPGKTIWMQEDAAALLSPELYEKFILPFNINIIDSFRHTIMHLHPSRFVPVKYLSGSNIGVIEIHIDRGGPRAEELLGYYMQVLPEKPLLIWGDVGEDDLDFIFTRLPHRGLAVNMIVSSVDEAHEKWEKVMGKYC